MESLQPVLLLGARSFAPEIADVVSEVDGLEVVAFVENLDRARCADRLEGLPILWIDDIAELASTHLALGAMGSTHRRAVVERAVEIGFRFATVVHPSAQISSRAVVGEGSIVSAGAVVASHVRIGRHVLVNRGALVGHHTEIGDFSSIMPGANIASSCRIGEGAYVGIGAVIVDHLTVGSGSLVGAGSVVTKDVPPHVQVAGMPARVVREDAGGL